MWMVTCWLSQTTCSCTTTPNMVEGPDAWTHPKVSHLMIDKSGARRTASPAFIYLQTDRHAGRKTVNFPVKTKSICSGTIRKEKKVFKNGMLRWEGELLEELMWPRVSPAIQRALLCMMGYGQSIWLVAGPCDRDVSVFFFFFQRWNKKLVSPARTGVCGLDAWWPAFDVSDESWCRGAVET